MAHFIAHRHQQQDRMCSNQRLCTLCVFNLCLLFGDNQTRLGGSKVGGIWRHGETESCRKYRKNRRLSGWL